MAKTDGVLLNTIGWKLDDDPQPILYIGPTQKNVESIAGSAQKGYGRVGPMLRQVASLWAGLAKGKSEKITEKYVNGVRLGFGWAGSATELASHPAALGLLDEYDRMRAVRGEGDPLALLRARTGTYVNGKIVITSTPLEGAVTTVDLDTGLTHWEYSNQVLSPTWQLWQEGTRHEWVWPCPHCEEYFIPRRKLLFIPKDATAQEALEQAGLVCPHCGGFIEDRHKEGMNDRGRFAAPGQRITKAGEVQGLEPRNRKATFWVSGLCSNWVSFGERAAELVDAQRSGKPEREQVAVNTGFGELFHLSGEAPAWEQVLSCKAGYERGTVPAGVWALTAGVDVQEDCLYWVVRGWGEELTSWLIDYGRLLGDTEKPGVWNRLTGVLNRRWGAHDISLMLVDEGYRKDAVQKWAKNYIQAVMVAKGQFPYREAWRLAYVDKLPNGKPKKSGLKRINWDTDRAKLYIHRRIDDWDPEQPGGWYVPTDVEEGYCRQLVAEQRVVNDANKVIWITTGDNHYLDGEAMALTAARVLGVENWAPPEPQPVAPPPPSNDWLNANRGSSWL